MTMITDERTLRDDHLDVGPPNVVAMRDMLGEVERERHLEPGTLVNQLWARLPAGWTAEDVLGEYIPLPVYGRVERNFFRLMGNPHRAREMAKQAMRFQFGGILLNDYFRFGARLLLPPEYVYGKVIPNPKTMRTYNLNKQLEVVARSETSVTYRVLYADNEGNRYTRTPEEDMGSLVFWAPGFTAATAALWVGPAAVTYQHLELDLIEFLNHFREFMQVLEIVVQGDQLMVNGQVVARRVTCYKDAAGHFTSVTPLNGDGADEEVVESKPGWQVTQDIMVLAPDGRPWPVAYAKTVFAKQSGCSLIQYSWAPHSSLARAALALFTRFTRFSSVRRLMDQPLSDRLQLMEASETIRRQKARLRLLADQNRDKQVDTYPTPAIADLVVRNRYRQHAIPGVAMFLDIAGSTDLTERVGSEVAAERMDAFWAEVAAVLWRYSAWNSQRNVGDPIVWVADEPGDGAMLVISDHFDPIADRPNEAELLRAGLVATGLQLAMVFHDAIAKVSDATGRPLRLRCGLAYGQDIVLRVRGLHGGRMAASGKSLNAAARYEAAGKLPGVAAPDGRTTVLPQALANLVVGEFKFAAAGIHHLKGLEVPTELVRLVEDPIVEAQAYTPLPPPGVEPHGVQQPAEPANLLRFPVRGDRVKKHE